MASTKLNLMTAKCNNFSETARRLYGDSVDLEQAAARFWDLGQAHESMFGQSAYRFFSSPGRIELCGNHTDHQHGKVLAASINLDTLAAVSPCEDSRIVVKSGAYPIIDVSLHSLDKQDAEVGTSLALIKGVARYFVDHGYRVGGFVATMTSNVARGSGVSSSASFECCVAEILNVLYNDGAVSAVEKAKASQWAESEYFGKPCGLLDQCAIALGGVSYIDFADPASPAVEKLDFPFDATIMLVNSGGDHTKLTDCYTAIRTEMQEVAHLLGGDVLRDVQADNTLFARCIQAGLPGRAALRAHHFFAEEARVDAAVEAIKHGTPEVFYDQLNASGLSSAYYLQNTCVPGDDRQPINVAVEFLRSLDAECCRVHGGGFAGTVLGIFHSSVAREAYRSIVDVYGKDNVFEVSIRPDGAVATDVIIG